MQTGEGLMLGTEGQDGMLDSDLSEASVDDNLDPCVVRYTQYSGCNVPEVIKVVDIERLLEARKSSQIWWDV